MTEIIVHHGPTNAYFPTLLRYELETISSKLSMDYCYC